MFSPDTPIAAALPIDTPDVPSTFAWTRIETNTAWPYGRSGVPGGKNTPACWRRPVVLASAIAASTPPARSAERAITTPPAQLGPGSMPETWSLSLSKLRSAVTLEISPSASATRKILAVLPALRVRLVGASDTLTGVVGLTGAAAAPVGLGPGNAVAGAPEPARVPPALTLTLPWTTWGV